MHSRTGQRVDRRLLVPAEPVSVSVARRFVTQLLAEASCDCSLAENAELMLSELVTNAVRFQRDGAIEISAVLRGPALRVSVTDDSGEVPMPRRSGASSNPAAGPSIDAYTSHAASGRGLLLLERLATRWGWAPLEVGKVVWFEAVCVCRAPGAARPAHPPD